MCETDKQTCLNAINLTCVAYLSILKFWTQGTGQRSWNSGILKNNNNNRIKVSDDREKSNRYYLSVLTITYKHIDIFDPILILKNNTSLSA